MADWLTLAFAYAGGACMGSYPIFVKTQPVLRAKVHPIIFQSYKSAWVGATGIVLLALRALFQASPIYIFSPWGVLSAVAWVPAGLAVITAVPLIGAGLKQDKRLALTPDPVALQSPHHHFRRRHYGLHIRRVHDHLRFRRGSCLFQ